MSQTIGYLVVAIIVGVPFGAVAVAYRDRFAPHLLRFGKGVSRELIRIGPALMLHPPYPALSYRLVPSKDEIVLPASKPSGD